MIGRSFTRALTLATIVSLLLSSVAFADTIQTDKDTLTTGTAGGALNLTLNPGATQTIHIGALIYDTGKAGVSFNVPVAATVASGADILGNPSPASGSIAAYGEAGEFKTDVVVTAPSDPESVKCNQNNGFTGKIKFLVTDATDAAALNSNGSVLQQINLTVPGGACSVEPDPNVPPTVGAAISGDASVDEGDDESYSISATDADNDTLTYAWSVVSGNAVINGASNASSVTLDFTDGPSTVDLQVVVGDGQAGHAVSRNLSITVANVNPAATLGNNGPKAEGSAVTASFTSPNDVAADTTSAFPLKYSFACSGLASSLAASYATAGTAASVQCTYTDNGSYTIAGRVFDKDEGYSSYTTSVTVDNAAPVVAVPAWQTPATINCGQAATLTNISFSDAGVNDSPWALDIDWGDNSTDFSTSVATQGGQSNQSHTYTAPGTYTATVSVTDKDGGQGSNSTASNLGLLVNQYYLTTFLAPLDGSTPSQLIANTMKKGRVVPIKVTIKDNCTGLWVNDPTANVTIDVKTAIFQTNSTDAVESFSDAGSSSAQTTAMRFNADSTMVSGGFWMYNLDTNGLTVGVCYKVAPKVASVLNTSTFAILKPTK